MEPVAVGAQDPGVGRVQEPGGGLGDRVEQRRPGGR
jgi:hypothetical protein